MGQLECGQKIWARGERMMTGRADSGFMKCRRLTLVCTAMETKMKYGHLLDIHDSVLVRYQKKLTKDEYFVRTRMEGHCLKEHLRLAERRFLIMILPS